MVYGSENKSCFETNIICLYLQFLSYINKKRKIKLVAMEQRKYNYIEEYLNKIRAAGGFTFTYSELLGTFNVTKEAIDLSLQRLKARNSIAQIKKGFYVILTPEYAQKGMIPSALFVDDLMKSLNKKYYVGLLSAAALHGASHQQPLEYFVITQAPAIRDINASNMRVRFFVKKDWHPQSVVQIKSDSGYMNVSSPELTALDLFFYSHYISTNRAYTVLQELQEAMKPSKLKSTALLFPQTASIQRLGYILEQIQGCDKLADSLKKVLNTRKSYYIPLSSGKLKKGSVNTRWKIIINTELDGDL